MASTYIGIISGEPASGKPVHHGVSTSATLTTRTGEPAKIGQVRSRSAAREAHDEPSHAEHEPRHAGSRAQRGPAPARGPRLRRRPIPGASTRSCRGLGSRRRRGRPASGGRDRRSPSPGRPGRTTPSSLRPGRASVLAGLRRQSSARHHGDPPRSGRSGPRRRAGHGPPKMPAPVSTASRHDDLACRPARQHSPRGRRPEPSWLGAVDRDEDSHRSLSISFASIPGRSRPGSCGGLLTTRRGGRRRVAGRAMPGRPAPAIRSDGVPPRFDARRTREVAR